MRCLNSLATVDASSTVGSVVSHLLCRLSLEEASCWKRGVAVSVRGLVGQIEDMRRQQMLQLAAPLGREKCTRCLPEMNERWTSIPKQHHCHICEFAKVQDMEDKHARLEQHGERRRRIAHILQEASSEELEQVLTIDRRYLSEMHRMNRLIRDGRGGETDLLYFIKLLQVYFGERAILYESMREQLETMMTPVTGEEMRANDPNFTPKKLYLINDLELHIRYDVIKAVEKWYALTNSISTYVNGLAELTEEDARWHSILETMSRVEKEDYENWLQYLFISSMRSMWVNSELSQICSLGKISKHTRKRLLVRMKRRGTVDIGKVCDALSLSEPGSSGGGGSQKLVMRVIHVGDHRGSNEGGGSMLS